VLRLKRVSRQKPWNVSLDSFCGASDTSKEGGVEG